MEVEILHAKSGKNLATLTKLKPTATINDVKVEYQKLNPGLYPDRQSYRTEKGGRLLKGDQTLQSMGITTTGKLYFKDLGPQIGWNTVFLTEYTGPLLIYLLIYARPALVFGAADVSVPRTPVSQIACACWTFHFAKRLLETIFVHRFSHATMPIKNIFKNSGFYWCMAALVSYYVSHPLYSPPVSPTQIYVGLGIFIVCELGNLSIHLALRNLRPPGTKERRIPFPTSNPFTALFTCVSCPNYTYETGAWLGFAIMTHSWPAYIYCFLGFLQMAVWAKSKHKNYKKEFKDYPLKRTAILPFLI